MIRLVGRRLIIPQGDTGSFTIPTQGTVSIGDEAILSIYDLLLHKTIKEKKIEVTAENLSSCTETLTFNFDMQDTLTADDGTEIEADDRGNRYAWDVTIIRNPLYDENNEFVHADDIDSYYSAFGLPACVIKRVTRHV